MPKNLEFKAHVGELNSSEEIFLHQGAVFSGVLNQRDTYFNVPVGRLKLRETAGREAELIFYERDEGSPGGMESRYSVLHVSDLSLRVFLAKALGVKTVVEKERKLLMLKNARIHIDDVKGLGRFIEFEVVASGDPSAEDARADAALLETLKGYAALFIVKEINESYSDMMLKL